MPTNTEKAGGSRYSEGKTSGWWFAPIYGIYPVVRVAQQGAVKYAPMDWKEGQSFSTLFDCMMRHIMAAQWKGIWSVNEKDGTEWHLAHAAWNLLTLLAFMEQGREDLDDITPWRGVTADEGDYQP